MSDVTQRIDALEREDEEADRVSEAIRTQDELRDRSGDWSGECEVRRWRSRRS